MPEAGRLVGFPLRPQYVGERERHRSRETGVLVVLLDGNATRMVPPGEGGRWVTLCEDHGYYGRWPSLSAARGWQAYPSEWCPVCEHLQGGAAPVQED